MHFVRSLGNGFSKAFACSRSGRLIRYSAFALLLLFLITITTVFLYKYVAFHLSISYPSILKLGITFGLAFILIYVLYSLLGYRKENRLAYAPYLAALLVSGLFFMAVFTPGTVPDERSHYLSSYRFSNVIQQIEPSDHAMSMRVSDKLFLDKADRQELEEDNYNVIKDEALPIITDRTSRFYYSQFGSSEFTSINAGWFPQLKLAPALGIAIGQALSMNGLWTYYLGRLFNFLYFVALVFAAVRISPVGKPLFVALSLLPMTLHVAASYSYDAGIIGMSFLLIAMFLKCIFSRSRIPLRMKVGMIVLCILLVPCKIIYGLLVCLVFFVPASNFKDTKTSKLFKASVILASLLSLGLLGSNFLLDVIRIDELTGSESQHIVLDSEPPDPKHSVSEFITSPLNTLFILVNTVFEASSFYLQSFLGGSLGPFQVNIIAPWSFMLVYLALLFVAAQRSVIDEARLGPKLKAGFIILTLVMSFGIIVSMFTAWTSESWIRVEGVQGRYFLPFAPLFLLVSRLNFYRLKTAFPASYLVLGMHALNSMYLLYIYAAVVRLT